jgi:hypothetical protein
MEIWKSAVVLALLLGFSSCSSSEKIRGSFKSEIPEGVTAPWAAISLEGRGWAYTELQRSEAFIVTNGRRMGPYRSIDVLEAVTFLERASSLGASGPAAIQLRSILRKHVAELVADPNTPGEIREKGRALLQIST